MDFHHISRAFRSLVFLVITLALVGAMGLLWWANRTGLPEPWRVAIENEIGKQGVHVKIGGLSYLPLRGVVASDVRVFSDASSAHEISRLERVLLGFDKTKLARGKIEITKVELKNAGILLPVDPQDPTSDSLKVTRANGTLLMPGNRRFEIRNASGSIAGIDVTLNARLIGYQQEGESDNTAKQRGQRREFLAKVIHELRKWHFDDDQPPSIVVFLEGNANDSTSLSAKFALKAKSLEKNDHMLESVAAEAEIFGDILTITSLKATDSRGSLKGRIDYDISDREGRFEIRSELELPPLLKAWLDLPPLQHIVFGGGQSIAAEGEFQIGEKNIPKVHMTGKARCESVLIKGVHFNAVESLFSWREGDLFLRNVLLSRSDGQAQGKAMIQWPLVRLALDSTFPEQVFKPFFIGQPLEKVIGDFTDREGAEVRVSLEGGFDATDRHSWAYTGSGSVKHVNYRGVPIHAANCKFSLSHHELDFHDGTVVFNYQDYLMRKAFDGPSTGTAKIGRIRFDAASKTVEVDDVAGTFWAAPLVRLFAPKVADGLEAYRFHKPPQLKGSGIVDVTPQRRTSLDIDFTSETAADYVFLGENITLLEPSGKVGIRGERVLIQDLKTRAFDGPVVANFEFNGKGRLAGETSWTQLSIPALASTYGFNIKGGGTVTGRLEFDITDGKVESMNGAGLFALERTELFSVPMFGPLSPVISGVLSDRRAGFERAKDAFCNFSIKEGILETHDFQTATKSLTFLGEGSVDLKNRELDMIMRMNAKGLLGLITLPLRPFYGMFQFRGTGPLKDTKWENVMFTTPSPEQAALLAPTPRATVVGERD